MRDRYSYCTLIGIDNKTYIPYNLMQDITVGWIYIFDTVEELLSKLDELLKDTK